MLRPSLRFLVTKSRVRCSCSIRTSAMRCRAALAWRSPPRLRRCRVVLPLDAGIGDAPQSAANAASLRRGLPPVPHSLHPDVLVLDQPGRTVLRLRPRRSAPTQRPGPRSRHSQMGQGLERRSEAIHLDQARGTDPRVPQPTSTANSRRRALGGSRPGTTGVAGTPRSVGSARRTSNCKTHARLRTPKKPHNLCPQNRARPSAEHLVHRLEVSSSLSDGERRWRDPLVPD